MEFYKANMRNLAMQCRKRRSGAKNGVTFYAMKCKDFSKIMLRLSVNGDNKCR